MRRLTREDVALQLFEYFKRLDESRLRPLAARCGADDSGQREDVARKLAELMAQPSWARERFGSLSPSGRSALRLVLRAGGSARADDLDAFAGRHAGSPAPGGATELYDAGLCWALEERSYRGSHLRYRVVTPLVMRWTSLLDELESEPAPPPVPAESELRYAEWRPVYEEAIVLAAIEAVRPRGKGFGRLHKTDETALAKSLAGLFGTSQDAAVRRIERLAGEGPLRLDGGRLRLDDALLARIPPTFARVAASWARVHRYNRPVLTLLARACDATGWCSERTLIEAAAPFMLAGHPSGSAGHELETALAHFWRFPGVLVREHDGHRFAWAASVLKAVSRGGLPDGTPPPGRALVQPNLQVTVQVDCDPVEIARLGRVARLVAVGEASVFAVDEALVRRAAAEGLEGLDVVRRLERFSITGVPPTVARALADWGRAGTTLDVVVNAMVIVGDLTHAKLQQLLPEARLTPLAAGVFVVDEVTPDLVVRVLREAGIGARLHVPPGLSDESGGDRDEPSITDPATYLADVFTEARKALRESRDADAGLRDG